MSKIDTDKEKVWLIRNYFIGEILDGINFSISLYKNCLKSDSNKFLIHSKYSVVILFISYEMLLKYFILNKSPPTVFKRTKNWRKKENYRFIDCSECEEFIEDLYFLQGKDCHNKLFAELEKVRKLRNKIIHGHHAPFKKEKLIESIYTILSFIENFSAEHKYQEFFDCAASALKEKNLVDHRRKLNKAKEKSEEILDSLAPSSHDDYNNCYDNLPYYCPNCENDTFVPELAEDSEKFKCTFCGYCENAYLCECGEMCGNIVIPDSEAIDFTGRGDRYCDRCVEHIMSKD